MSPKVTLVDYGIGNLLSVRRGFEYWGFDVLTTDNPQTVIESDRVVLPGVGSFGLGMKELIYRGLDVAIRSVALSGTPLLAICLGMQLLFEEGEEYGFTAGLGIIKGKVSLISNTSDQRKKVKVPHIGWNAIQKPIDANQWSNSVLRETQVDEEFYFNHSFSAEPSNTTDVLATCQYGGNEITAVVNHGSTTGCQFHPEKSGEMGLRILKNFVEQ
jgi:glutamine amidotransferase